MNKYRNKKVTLPDGQVFDSQKEAIRFGQLRLMEKAHVISDLRRQVKYELIPKQKGERSVTYTADFVYKKDGREIVEDTKGYRTEVYKIKRKLMLYIHGIKITEL